jgi:5'-nucleotidase
VNAIALTNESDEEVQKFLRRALDAEECLRTSEADVQQAIDAGHAAALIYDPPDGFKADDEMIRIAFDADAVLFSEESERVFKEQGLEAFQAHERKLSASLLPEGPLAKLLLTLSFIQQSYPPGKAPVRIAVVTARGSPSHERVIRTLRAWNVAVDEAFFLGGLKKKGDILKAFRAHIFFDDQEVHLEGASKVVPSARVPYRSDSPLRKKEK